MKNLKLYIPDEQIYRFPLEKYFELKRIKSSKITTRRGQQLKLQSCIFCGKDEHFFIHLRTKLFICHSCNNAGNLGDLISILEETESHSFIKRLVRNKGFYREYRNPDKINIKEVIEQEKSEMEEEVKPIDPPEYFTLLNKANEYLRSRGISDEDVRFYKMGFCFAGRYAKRIIIPIIENGKWYGFVGRISRDRREGEDPKEFKKKKFRNTKDAPFANLLFNIEEASKHNEVVITESVLDSVSVGRDGTCTFGKKISDYQIRKLLDYNVRSILLLWDSDAREDMVKTIPKLRFFFKVRALFLKEGDPNSNRENLRKMMKKDSESFIVSRYEKILNRLN